MADRSVLEARLSEAEDALHRLSIGAMEVEIRYEGHSVKYTMSTEARLVAYINRLKRDLGQPVAARSRRVRYS
ncbi:gpW family head-tail joining protein [Frigidibacter sp. MR17.14]|uniref:gpW family head-tail joining protein n=1 Tax=Frigidibacter sp. MR17.14 TaxID=3126509 RepID=UPI003012C19D